MTARRPRAGIAILSNRAGSALIEFGIMAPFLVSLLLGMFDLGPALMVRFKLTSATQAVADLVTQSATVQPADVANFLGAGADVLAPFSASTLQFRITNIASDGKNRAFVYWSCGQGILPPYTAATTVSSTPTGTGLPTLLYLSQSQSGKYNLDGTNTSFVMVESAMTFKPPAGFVLRSDQALTDTAYAMPRVSTYIGPTYGDPNYTPPKPTSISSSYAIAAGGITCNVGL